MGGNDGREAAEAGLSAFLKWFREDGDDVVIEQLGDEPLTVGMLRAVLDENARMRQELAGLSEQWATRAPSGAISLPFKPAAIPTILKLNPTVTPVKRLVGEWVDAAPQQPARDAQPEPCDGDCDCDCQPGQPCLCPERDCYCGPCPVCDRDETEHAPGGETP